MAARRESPAAVAADLLARLATGLGCALVIALIARIPPAESKEETMSQDPVVEAPEDIAFREATLPPGEVLICAPGGREISVPPPEEEEAGLMTGAPSADGLAPWEALLTDQLADMDYAIRLIEAVRRASALTQIPPEAICAVLSAESGFRHYDEKGAVLGGDYLGGVPRSIGIGQVGRHKSTMDWQRCFSYNADWPDGERKVDLDDLGDNVLCCAALLWRGGWSADSAQAQLAAYAYYNSGKHRWDDAPAKSKVYAHTVAKRARQIAAYCLGPAPPAVNADEEQSGQAARAPSEEADPDDYLADPPFCDDESQPAPEEAYEAPPDDEPQGRFVEAEKLSPAEIDAEIRELEAQGYATGLEVD